MGLDFNAERLETVRTIRDGKVATIRFSTRVLYFETLTRLRELVDSLREEGGVETLYFETEGKNFLLGADVDYFYEAVVAKRIDRIATYSDLGNDLFDAIEKLPFPTIAKIEGAALGGGFELALACSGRVATPNASFAFPETGLGIFPGWGGIKRLRRRVGAALAKWIVFTGKSVPATLARELKIVDAIASRDDWNEASQSPIETIRREGGVPTLKEIPETQKEVAAFFERPLRKILEKEPTSPEERRLRAQLDRRAPISLDFAERIFDAAATLAPTMERRFEDVLTWRIYQTPDAELGLDGARSGKLGKTPFSGKF